MLDANFTLTSTWTAGLKCQYPQSNQQCAQHPPSCLHPAYPKRAQRSEGGYPKHCEGGPNLSPDQPNSLPGLGVWLCGSHLANMLKTIGGGREAAVQLHCLEAIYKLAKHTLYDSCGKLCGFVVAALLFVCFNYCKDFFFGGGVGMATCYPWTALFQRGHSQKSECNTGIIVPS